MTIYISGPMTGLPNYNHPAFFDAAHRLRDAGFDVINPADQGVIEGHQWHHYLRSDIAKLVDCDSILMLDGWMDSKGARLERHIAVELGMPIYYDIDELIGVPA